MQMKQFVTQNKKMLQHQLKNILHIAEIMGLKFNPDKCAVLNLERNNTGINFIIKMGTNTLRSLKLDDHYRCLGFHLLPLFGNPKKKIIKSEKFTKLQVKLQL